MKPIILYTDGASRNNPGPAGWASIIVTEKTVREIAGGEKQATNNQMELEAVIRGLRYIQEQYGYLEVQVYTDSTYVLRGMNDWMDTWKKNGWVTSTKKPVENKDRWHVLLELQDSFNKKISVHKVAGHSGHRYNDRCDELAVACALGQHPTLFSGTVQAYESLYDSESHSPTHTRSTERRSGAPYSYVSLVDGKVYVDKDWPSCEGRVKGKAARYKKVFSKEEETALIQDFTLQSLL